MHLKTNRRMSHSEAGGREVAAQDVPSPAEEVGSHNLVQQYLKAAERLGACLTEESALLLFSGEHAFWSPPPPSSTNLIYLERRTTRSRK